jgi:hypothetical protein
MDHGDLINRFSYHKPSDEKAVTHADIRGKALDFALWLDTVLPDGRDKSCAITKLEEVMYWANASVARS